MIFIYRHVSRIGKPLSVLSSLVFPGSHSRTFVGDKDDMILHTSITYEFHCGFPVFLYCAILRYRRLVAMAFPNLFIAKILRTTTALLCFFTAIQNDRF